METATTPLPLQRYRLFESHDMDEARESVARVFCPHGLVMLRPRTELDACHHSARLHRDVSLNYVQYGPGVQIDPGYLQDFFLLQIPLRGGAEIRCGAQHVDATPRLASLPSPTELLSMRWADDSPHLIVRLARPALLSRLESLLQAPVGKPLVFDLGVPLDNPTLAPLVHFIDYLRLTLDAGKRYAFTEINLKALTQSAPVVNKAFYKTWWFWTVVGVVVAGSATATAVTLTGTVPKPPAADFSVYIP